MTSVSHTLRQMYASLIALWAITAIHHAYEAARYPALHYPEALLAGVGGFTAFLLLTLALLDRYERTGSKQVYFLFSAVVILLWVGVVGVNLSANYYVLRNLLFLTHAAPLATLRHLWPVEQVPPNDLFHEGTGILIFFCALWVAVAWQRLESARRHTAVSLQDAQKANARS
jgi:hypothetical protein